MKRLALLVLALNLLSHSNAYAASKGSKGSRWTKERREHKELYAGFSHAHSGSAGLNGWQVSGALPFDEKYQLLADVAHHSGSYAGADLGQTAFLAGVATSADFHVFRPFVRILAGAVHTTTTVGTISASGTHVAFGGGVGATYPFSDALGVRGQIDLLLSHGNGSWDTSPRFGIGIAYRFKK